MAADDSADFERTPMKFVDRVTADAADGWPVEAGRYRLVVNRACPWAHRSVIVRRLMGLDDAISLGVTDPIQEDIEGAVHWVFTAETGSPGGLDPVLGVHALRDSYLKRAPDYDGGVSVPGLVDVPSGHLVTNDYDQLTLDLESEWTALHREGAPDLYPVELRDGIDELNDHVYRNVANGVYRSGFAPSQASYDRAVRGVFEGLDGLEDRLTRQRFLMGDRITEADVRLYPTLARFDAVYHGHFKCNARKLIEYPALWAYARDLFQTPGFGDTTHFDHIRRHYYGVHVAINPTGIVAVGPDPAGWLTPHFREQLGGSPFGDGTPPGPPPAIDRVPAVVPSAATS